jgi:hypothetical protein
MGTVTSEFHNLNENSHLQNFSTEFSTPHLRPRSNSAPQESTPNSTSFSNAPIRESQQRKSVKKCHCGLEPVLKEVKNTQNKGRWFYSCSKFGGLNHLERCNFFRWETPLPQNTDATVESSSTTQNTSERYLINNNNNDDDDDVKDDNNVNNNVILSGEIITSPLNDSDVIVRVIENPRRSHNRAPSQALSNSSNGTTTNNRSTNPVAVSNTTTGDIYTRKPAVFGNWENVPKYSTPQLLDIMQNHLVQQGKVKILKLII